RAGHEKRRQPDPRGITLAPRCGAAEPLRWGRTRREWPAARYLTAARRPVSPGYTRAVPSTQELLAEARRQLAELRAALRQEALLGERLRRSRIGRRDRDPPVAPLS